MNLGKKLSVIYFFITFILLIVLVIVFYIYSQRFFIDREFNFLQQTAEVKILRINEFYQTLANETRIIQKYYNIRSHFPVLLQYQNNPQSEQYIVAKNHLDDQLSAWFGTRTDVEDIMLVDQNGVVFYTVNPFNQKQYLNKALENLNKGIFKASLDTISISDLTRQDISSNRFFLFVQAPISDLLGKEKAFVVLKIRANLLYQLIQDTSGLGQTGESLIGKVFHDIVQNTDYILFLNPLRNDPNAAFKRKVLFGQPDSIPIQKAAMKENGFGISIDYRGKQVLSVWRYLPEQNWAFVTKIDKSEALEPIIRMAIFFFILALISSVVIAIIIGYYSKRVTTPIKRLALIADKIAKADFNEVIPPDIQSSKDEVGFLGRSIDNMRDNLASLYASLEQKVKERTSELENKTEDLSKMNKLMINRELKMIELKKEIDKLRQQSIK